MLLRGVLELFCVSLLLWRGKALYAVDLATPTSVSTFTCLKNAGFSAAIVRAYQSYGQSDSGAPANIANARSAGFQYVDVYAFPCRGLDATTQMNDMINYLSGYNSNYGMIWLDLESNPKTSCYWTTYSSTDNCNYVKQMVSAVRARGKRVGIYSSYGNWEMIFGSASSCASFTDVPLWYAHYDNSASFSDWSSLSFGGWTKPAMKQYVGDTTVCSTDIDKSIEAGFYTSSAYSGGGSSTSCTTPVSQGGVAVKFPSGVSLTSIKTCDTAYTDPNNAGTYVFSISSSGATTKLSSNFQLGEFKSPDGADGVRVSPYLITCLQNVRTTVAQSLYIQSSYQTTTYSSSKNGGTTQSYHMSGTAADIYISGDVMTVAKAVICQCRDYFVSNSGDIGLGLGDTFVHVDMRKSFSSWVEAGAKYTSTQWLSYISSTYKSCSGKYGGIPDSGTGSDGGHNTGCTGSGVKFPNTCLTPVYYTDSKYNDPNKAGESLFSASQSGLNTLLSNNFAVKEFVCKDGSDGFRLAPELVQCLQTVRDTLKTSVVINSAYRTVTHNSDEGGAQYSRHMSGTAADSYSDAGLWNYANAVICKCRAIFQSNGQDIGLGLGGTYIHLDMRPYYSYWTYSDATMSADSWNNYITTQWSKCSSSSRSDVTNQDITEDQAHSDQDTSESLETDTADSSSSSSSSFSTNNKNVAIIVPVVVIGALAIIALLAYFIYRRIAISRKLSQEAGDIPLSSYVNLQDQE